MTQGLAFDLAEPLHEVEAAGLFVSLCSISRHPSPPNTDGSGAVIYNDYAPVAGLQNIPCQLGVWRMKPDIAAVSRLPDRFETLSERHALLDGYFPAILQRDLATVDGNLFEIMAVEHDSQFTFTRLALRSYVQ